MDENVEIEVIIVDNGSKDDTRLVCASEVAQSRMNIKYFYEPIPGLLSGRHRGAFEAVGDVCAFLDDDVQVSQDWIGGLIEAFRDSQVVLAGGPSEGLFEANPDDWLNDFFVEDENGSYCSWLSLLDSGHEPKEVNPLFVWGLNFAIRKETLFDLGGFNPDCMPRTLQRYQGDGESGLSLKIQAAGLKAFYHPAAKVLHEVPASRLTVEYFERRAFYQGVCDSYSDIRARKCLVSTARSWKEPLRSLKRFISRLLRRHQSTTELVRSRTAVAYQLGYSYHHNEVDNDPKLLSWVLKSHYLDYGLPLGWQSWVKDCEN